MRHMGWLFEELDLVNDKENRRMLDGVIRDVLSAAPDAHCPEVWKAVKEVPQDELVAKVKAAWG